jgi:D-serine deaminase-like pyridoxal phosphate-dependent protein
MLASAGATDVLFAYNPVGPNCDRISRLAKAYSHCRFTVTAEANEPIRALSAAATNAGVTIGVMLDINVGMNRTGITPETTGIVDIYKLTGSLAGLRPAGFHVYDGHQRQVSLTERKAAVAIEWPRVQNLKARCEAAGMNVPALACGGTPTFPCYAAMSDPQIELCPGTCVFHDAGYGMTFPDLPFEPAAWIVTRVVSRPAADRVTFDVGNKAVAADPPKGARIYFPDLPGAVQDNHSEEHMVLVSNDASRYRHGDVLMAIPVHICPTSALYDRVPVISNGRIEEYWDVTSRNRRITI